MKKPDKRWPVRLGAAALAAALLGTVAVLAEGGGQEDPLVTLSYLNQTVTAQIMEQVEQKTAERQKELEQNLSALISQYQQTGTSGGAVSSPEGYTLLTLEDGQTLTLEVGCEVLLRVGSVSVQADSAPALIDLTSGAAVNTGAALTKNHLYLSTIEGRTLAASGTVKLLVRGGYAAG